MSEAAVKEDLSKKKKKSVALSGTAAGNTAICTVGRTGNDLHYRGYDILDLAEQCEFEEIAHLLIHEKLPTKSELAAYKAKLKSLRGIPAAVKQVLEAIPSSAHPMDVMRTAISAMGSCLPEKDTHPIAEARDRPRPWSAWERVLGESGPGSRKGSSTAVGHSRRALEGRRT